MFFPHQENLVTFIWEHRNKMWVYPVQKYNANESIQDYINLYIYKSVFSTITVCAAAAAKKSQICRESAIIFYFFLIVVYESAWMGVSEGEHNELGTKTLNNNNELCEQDCKMYWITESDNIHYR